MDNTLTFVYGIPQTGSTPVWCDWCGARGTANRALVKKGRTPTCSFCKGDPAKKKPDTPTVARKKERPYRPPTETCMRPLQHGPRIGQSAEGTPTGYGRHMRAGEQPCTPCSKAQQATWQKLKA